MSQVFAWLFLFVHLLFPHGFADQFNTFDCKFDDVAYRSNDNNEINHGLHLLSEKASPSKSDGHCNSVSILRFGIADGKKTTPCPVGKEVHTK